MSLLVLKYLPRGPRSRTLRLLDAFLEAVPPTPEETVDLAADPPRVLDTAIVRAYMERNYAGADLSPEDSALLREADRFTEQLQMADTVVLATPMYNFSLPAAVKGWFDAVMQKGKTWTAKNGVYRGLLEGKRAAILMTAARPYDGPLTDWDHALPLVRHCFEFMGFREIRTVRVDGLATSPERAEERLRAAEGECRKIAREWFEAVPRQEVRSGGA
ncbi:MAG: NAD(P)H-dependent oxidoreductase [Acidobacteria bacterium]|nr:NAD(P)H-dependent oxidoreductase [Acidobacteriota bacterium]MCG3195228.1 FMN-dependent NADH-azoreductase [Thermoanaerobaculia bacterium]MCK6684689.1 NAD(P)H-dependent oxidoreductase [Thermoanaerobaculia bacterium]